MFPLGTYECGFTKGSVRHTASATLDVALLPDVISMEISPLIADCTGDIKIPVNISVNATIPQSTEKYAFQWKINDKDLTTFSEPGETIMPLLNTQTNSFTHSFHIFMHDLSIQT